MNKLLAATQVLTILLWASSAFAAGVTVEIPVIGALQSASGGPVADGDYVVFLSLHADATTKVELFSETHKLVAVKSGRFAMRLGSTAKGGLEAALFSAGEAVWLAVSVGSDSPLPRVKFGVVPFAARAVHAETAKTADTAKVATVAQSAYKASAADQASSLSCTGCIKSGMLDKSVLAPFATSAQLAKVATSGKYSDLSGAPKASTVARIDANNAFIASNSFKGLNAGGQVKGMRLENAGKAPVACTAATVGYVYYDTAEAAVMVCNGKAWFQIGVQAKPGTPDNPAKSCKDALAKGSKASGVHTVTMGGKTFKVYCDQVTDSGGWTLLLNQTDGTLRHILQQDKELPNVTTAGAQKNVHEILEAATEIRYDDVSRVAFVTAKFDGKVYSTALKSGGSVPVAVNYAKGKLAGKTRYIEVNSNFHWGHRHNSPTHGGKTTAIKDIYNDNCHHTCWEDIAAKDRPFSGSHCPSGTSPADCPASSPTYKFPSSATRGGSFKFHKWVR